jgi:hypothetical protein
MTQVQTRASGFGETRVGHVLLAPCGGCTSQARASIHQTCTKEKRFRKRLADYRAGRACVRAWMHRWRALN